MRTDKYIINPLPECVPAEFARDLERENDRLLKLIGNGRGLNNEYDSMVGEQTEREMHLACEKLIDAIQSIQAWDGTYVGECIDALNAFLPSA